MSGPTRGERNNNPGNIRISNITWQGKVTPSKDTDFETFQSPEYGIRAIAKILLTDADKGFNTVRAIINKYAPSTENNTQAYISAVSEHLAVDPDKVLNLDDYDTMYGFVVAIIMHENGEVIYSDATINEGLKLAGIYNVPKPSVAAQPEAHAAAGAGVIATLSVASTAIQNASPAIPLIQQILTAAPWIISIIAVVGAAYMGYILYKKHSGVV